MSSTTETEPERQQSFAESALRLGGKSEDEARRMGAVDRADDQVESLFAPQYQTVNSPVHKAVWEAKVPLDLFSSPPLPSEASCDVAMEKCIGIVRQRRQSGSLYDEKGKIAPNLIQELGAAGYWGMLIDRRYGGQGAPFTRFARARFGAGLTLDL